MVARTPRKVTLVAGAAQNIRNTSGKPITFANYYYASGGGTVEIGKAGLTAGNGFPIIGGIPYHDIDQTMDRVALATTADVVLFIEEFEA